MKIILACTLLLLAIASVSAAENMTSYSLEETQEPAIGDGEIKLIEDNDYDVNIPKEISSDWISTVEVKNMPQDAGGNISISIDSEEKYNREVSVGINSLLINDLHLDYGTSHDVLVNYSGDNKYMGFSKSGVMNPAIYVNVPEYAIDGASMTVTFNKNLNGNIKVLIDENIVYNQPCSKGNVKISLDKYSPSTHTYEVIYQKASTRISEKGFFTRSKFYFEVMTMNGNEIKYGDNVTFEIYMLKNVAGTAKFKGKTYTFKRNSDKCVKLDVSRFDIGDNIVEFESTYKGITQKISYHIITIPKITMPTRLWTNGSYELIFKASKDFNGDLICTGMVNGIFNVANGSAAIPIPKMNPGKYKLRVSYENYSWKFTPKVLNETPAIKIDINYPEHLYPWSNDPDYWDLYHDDYIISVDSNYDLPKTTTVIHDNVKKEYSGSTILTEYPKTNEKGNHTITVIYSGDSIIKSANKTVTYEVTDYLCTIQDAGIVKVSIPGTESGSITVNVDGKKYATKQIKSTDKNWITHEFLLNNMQYDKKYNVEVIVNTKNIKFSKSENINLTYPIEIYTRDNFEYTDLNEKVIEFIMPKDIKSKATVSIDGKNYKYDKIEDYLVEAQYGWNYVPPNYMGYAVTIYGLKPGVHTAVVTYPGDSKYPSKSVNRTFNVTSSIEQTNYFYSFGSKIDLKLVLPKDATGNLSAEIRYAGEDEYKLFRTVAVKNGTAILRLPSDKIGKYDFKSYYRGNYLVEDYSDDIKIEPEMVMPEKMHFGDDREIRAHVENTSNTKMIIYISGDTSPLIPIAEVRLNETNVVKISDLNDKIKEFYTINYKTTGESSVYIQTSIYSKDLEFKNYAKTSVNFLNKIVGPNNINMHYGNAKYINLKIYDVYGRPVGKNEVVKITIGRFTFNAKTNENGAVKFKIPANIVPNTYKITAKYKSASKTTTLKVNQILSLSTVKIKKSAKKLVITAKMKNKKAMNAKIVTFKFAGKTIKAKTNKYGIAKAIFKSNVLKKLRVGNKITYTATYAKDTVKKTVRIGK